MPSARSELSVPSTSALAPRGAAWLPAVDLALTAVLRAAGCALLAAYASAGAEPLAVAPFLATWTLLFTLPLMGIGLVELPLRRVWLASRAARSPWSARAGEAAIGGLAAALLLRPGLVPVVGALGPLWPLAIALGGAVVVIRAAPSRGGARASPRRAALRGVLAALPLVAAGASLHVADPQGRYEARYRDTAAAVAALDPALRIAPAGAGGGPVDPRALGRALAETAMALSPPEQLRWLWEEAVLVEGLLAYARVSGDRRPLDYASRWVREHRAYALAVPLFADTAAPALPVVTLHALGRRDPADRALMTRIEQYCVLHAPRTREGCISHTGGVGFGIVPSQAWVDSLFMHGGFLNRLALARRGGPFASVALELAREQALAFAVALQDDATGFFRHAAIDLPIGRVTLPVEPCFWARGNAWTLWFLTEHIVTCRALGEGVPEAIVDSHRRLLIAVLAAQRGAAEGRARGLWRTDLEGNAYGNPVETTASALLGAALLASAEPARFGLRARVPSLVPDGLRAVVEEAGQGAVRGVARFIAMRGGRAVLHGASTGTHPGFRAYYRRVPDSPAVGHGTGAALLLFAVAEGLPPLR